jgi:hypothetical protein
VKSNQIDVLAFAVPGDAHHLAEARESSLVREVVGKIGGVDRLDRVDDDVTVFHSVAPADFDTTAHPDANAASDSAAADSLA